MKPAFLCKHCDKHFANEKIFKKHRCKEMIRNEDFRSHGGQIAWHAYIEWIKLNHRCEPSSGAFKSSRLFTIFLNFVTFAKKIHANIGLYVRAMHENDISPTLWKHNEAYLKYLGWIDTISDPKDIEELVKISANTIIQIADSFDADTGEIFDILHSNDVIALFRTRRLTPWLLYQSPKFMQFVVTQMSASEHAILETITHPEIWATKFKNNPKTLKRMKNYVSVLNL